MIGNLVPIGQKQGERLLIKPMSFLGTAVGLLLGRGTGMAGETGLGRWRRGWRKIRRCIFFD